MPILGADRLVSLVAAKQNFGPPLIVIDFGTATTFNVLDTHGDFYVQEHGIIGPKIVDGRLQIGSLHCTGFGFAVEPDMSTMESAETWTFESCGFLDAPQNDDPRRQHHST